MSKRQQAIMDVAERLIRSHGYNGFSFREVAAEVGIKSASVHYHYPAKSDLATAVARRYRERFEAAVSDEIAQGRAEVVVWRDLFRRAFERDGLMCLCGILAVEGDGLPDEVAAEARLFLENAIASITQDKATDPDQGLRILAQLEGAMLLARATGDVGVFDAATRHLL